jgi:HEXXH motif-containing protein
MFASFAAMPWHGVSSVVHPSFCRWYFQFADAVRSDSICEFHHLVEELTSIPDKVIASKQRAARNVTKLGYAIDLSIDDAEADRVEERLFEAASQAATGERDRLVQRTRFVLSPDKEIMGNLRTALVLLKQIWPEALQEFLEYVQQVVFLDTSDVIGASDVESLGAVFIGANEAVDPVRLSEELLHEASHNVLNTLAALEPVCLNSPDEAYFSPLRKDARPIFGIFHQLFVLARLTYYYRRLVSAGYEQCKEKRDDVQERFEKAVLVIQAHAKLAAAGEAILESAIELMRGTEEIQYENFHF